MTNTNRQWYSGESTMGHLVQMAGLAVQNFVSAAVGIAVAVALVRGFARSKTGQLGNFWVDLTRITLRILLPVSVVAAVALIIGGAVQNLSGGTDVTTLTGGSQTIIGGPVASQEAIKDLGTNGGGFRGLRGWTAVPIIVLSGRAGSGDKVAALDAGADDYVTKPFGVDELLARVRAVTRRASGAGGAATVRIGRYTVDLADHVVLSDDGSGEVRLTLTEWHLLEVLVRNPGKLVTQRQLLQQVWGPQSETETHYLRQYLAQLRRKLEADPAHPRHLLTEPGMGYRFRPDPSPAT